MRVALDVSPLHTGHKIRGVGFYLEHLKNSLQKYYPEHEYIYFTNEKELDGSIDIVHYPYFDPFFLSLPLIKKYKTIVTVHDLTPIIFPEHFPVGVKGGLRWQMQKMNLKKVDAIITDSNSSKKDIVEIIKIPEKKVSVTYLAAGEEFKQINKLTEKVIHKYSLPEKFVLYVGDVTWNKNLPNFVKAVKQKDLPLVMVGKSLAQKDFDRTNLWNRDLVEVQQLAADDSNIYILGFVPTEDLVVLYNNATVFVMPSIYEGFGLPVVEAMQSGCPVVTTEEGSLPEVAGDAAYYVDKNDIDNIASGLEKVFYDKNLQKELSKKSLKQAEKFNWKKTAEQTIAVYNSVLK